jgi:hypothetical protein
MIRPHSKRKFEMWIKIIWLTWYSYFDAMGRIARPDYMPSDQDILRARVKTTGIT